MHPIANGSLETIVWPHGIFSPSLGKLALDPRSLRHVDRHLGCCAKNARALHVIGMFVCNDGRQKALLGRVRRSVIRRAVSFPERPQSISTLVVPDST
jgi:hypothetical protein